MAEVWRFPDAAARAVRFLRASGFPRTFQEEPDGWDADSLLVLVQGAGGSGVYSHQLSDVRLTVEVRSGDQGEAAEAASTLEALLRDWPNREPGVYYRGTMSSPQYDPEPDRRIPAYRWTVVLSFRGSPLST